MMPALETRARIDGSSCRGEDVLPPPLTVGVRVLAIERKWQVHATVTLCKVALVQ